MVLSSLLNCYHKLGTTTPFLAFFSSLCCFLFLFFYFYFIYSIRSIVYFFLLFDDEKNSSFPNGDYAGTSGGGGGDGGGESMARCGVAGHTAARRKICKIILSHSVLNIVLEFAMCWHFCKIFSWQATSPPKKRIAMSIGCCHHHHHHHHHRHRF